jgi:hypothetical protein
VERDGTISGTFRNEGILAGAFTDTFNFTLPAGMAAFTASSVAVQVGGIADLDFTSIFFNNNAFQTLSTGQFESRQLPPVSVLAGPQTLVVNGVSRGNGSYSGDITFAMVPVPGPIAGAGLPVLMALGGFVWARRRKAQHGAAFPA